MRAPAPFSLPPSSVSCLHWPASTRPGTLEQQRQAQGGRRKTNANFNGRAGRAKKRSSCPRAGGVARGVLAPRSPEQALAGAPARTPGGWWEVSACGVRGGCLDGRGNFKAGKSRGFHAAADLWVGNRTEQEPRGESDAAVAGGRRAALPLPPGICVCGGRARADSCVLVAAAGGGGGGAGRAAGRGPGAGRTRRRRVGGPLLRAPGSVSPPPPPPPPPPPLGGSCCGAGGRGSGWERGREQGAGRRRAAVLSPPLPVELLLLPGRPRPAPFGLLALGDCGGCPSAQRGGSEARRPSAGTRLADSLVNHLQKSGFLMYQTPCLSLKLKFDITDKQH
ncbi:translation initiation factor IF-2-like [Antechinus flavipes]|uniref:translation initiation factor IF-2-like n=1 Tax=Antechinus flavipes TaxID=38775 RepID=UPI002236866C|nr:translation initiation factor IF-2-like [Antechinus flavipes]